MSKETLYRKVGRRYVPHQIEWDRERLNVGTFRLVYCRKDGEEIYKYDVTPDTAGFVAAAMIAEHAMISAINEAAIAKPSAVEKPYTKQQLEIVEKFRQDMAAAGGLVPDWWEWSSQRGIAEAAIRAVRDYRP